MDVKHRNWELMVTNAVVRLHRRRLEALEATQNKLVILVAVQGAFLLVWGILVIGGAILDAIEKAL